MVERFWWRHGCIGIAHDECEHVRLDQQRRRYLEHGRQLGSNAERAASRRRYGQFNIANSYAVSLNISPTVTTISVVGSNVTFAGNTTGRTLGTTTMFVNSGSLTLNSLADPITLSTTNTTNFNTTVNISNGNKVSVTGVGMGIAAASSSTTTVDGTGSNLTTSSLNLATPVSVPTTGVLTFSNSATGSLGTVKIATSGRPTAR